MSEGRKRLSDEVQLANDAKQWVEAIQEYANITELDAATLNRLIKEIVVHERIDQEITKVREKIAEYQEKLKALEAQKTEAENLEIVQMVRALRMTPTQLSAMLSGGTVPGSLADENNEQEENSYEE